MIFISVKLMTKPYIFKVKYLKKIMFFLTYYLSTFTGGKSIEFMFPFA